jgi:quercetin dioxygenase-like cupin family protein
METEKDLNAKIIAITMQILGKHPELSKYLSELPVTIPDEAHPQINIDVLSKHYDLLNNILRDYVLLHPKYILVPHPRPDANRVLDAPMLNFDLPTLIKNIKLEESWLSGKHNAKTLLKSESMRIVLIAMHEGNEMKTHEAEGSISVHIIEGKLKFTTESESTILQKGQLITLNKKIKHSLYAIEETTFLLTMVNEKRA